LKRGLVCFAQGHVSRRCTTEQHAELVTHELTNADQRIRDGSLLVMLLNIQRWLIVFFVSARRHGGHSLGGAVLSTGAKDDVELVAVVQGHILSRLCQTRRATVTCLCSACFWTSSLQHPGALQLPPVVRRTH